MVYTIHGSLMLIKFCLRKFNPRYSYAAYRSVFAGCGGGCVGGGATAGGSGVGSTVTGLGPSFVTEI